MRAIIVPALVLALAAAGPAAAPATAQDARAVVLGDTIRVGDVVPVAVRLLLQPGEMAVFPDTLGVPAGDLENVARVRERTDTLADGRVQVTAVYALTPWRPGSTPLPELPVRILGPDEGPRTVRVGMPAVEVASVLPEDTAGVEPRPARGVLGPSWALWPILLLLAALLLAAAALAWWLRRRRGATAPAVIEPLVPPRERALAALAEARDAGLADRGEWKELYTRISVALREYLHAIEPVWGEDLTTTELLGRLRKDAGYEAAATLGALLRPADQVKFARREPRRDEALEELEAARRWVRDFDRPGAGPAPTSEEAAA